MNKKILEDTKKTKQEEILIFEEYERAYIKTLEEINEEKIKLDKDYLKTAEEYSKRIREIQEEETEFFDKEIKKRNEILDNFRANIEHTTKALNKLNMPSNRQ